MSHMKFDPGDKIVVKEGVVDPDYGDVTIQNIPAIGSESAGKCMRIHSTDANDSIMGEKSFGASPELLKSFGPY